MKIIGKTMKVSRVVELDDLSQQNIWRSEAINLLGKEF